jgi:hypothetical protein
MSQLKAFSQITGDVLDIGPASEDLDAILGLGDMMAPHNDLIVYVEGPVLKKWEAEA